MLFLKRASDLFDQRQEEFRRELTAQGMSETDIQSELDDPDNYSGKYFGVGDAAPVSLCLPILPEKPTGTLGNQ